MREGHQVVEADGEGKRSVEVQLHHGGSLYLVENAHGKMPCDRERHVSKTNRLYVRALQVYERLAVQGGANRLLDEVRESLHVDGMHGAVLVQSETALWRARWSTVTELRMRRVR